MNPWTALATASLLGASFWLLAGCSKEEQVMTYEDCLLESGRQARLAEALATMKLACKGKFPKVFDFDEIASRAEVAKWLMVATKPEFHALDEAARSEARGQYFEDVVRPRVHPDYVEDARVQFDAFSRRIEKWNPTSAASSQSDAASSAR